MCRQGSSVARIGGESESRSANTAATRSTATGATAAAPCATPGPTPTAAVAATSTRTTRAALRVRPAIRTPSQTRVNAQRRLPGPLPGGPQSPFPPLLHQAGLLRGGPLVGLLVGPRADLTARFVR